ncbi:hypothetical protein [Actinoplanes palleronii]|uniref:Uncharacterized protein n=1 Tax=Actinoplanes palleronii TaxID=113570 RepID=A0ABQ4BJ60_9ACTN|nr:hypothetical protein [Actinoplanes palleronii]GIE70714.1 hypothetical protein Apa02nite_068220 [Actinoplanes palleronii]
MSSKKDRAKCHGAPENFEADCGQAGPHGWHVIADPEGPPPYGTRRPDSEDCWHDRKNDDGDQCFDCGKRLD